MPVDAASSQSGKRLDYVLSERRRVPCLVTLGSPLWMASVMEALFRWHDRGRPVEIGEWLNVFDGRDVVGGGLPMRRTWGQGPTDVKVDQGEAPSYHGIGGYLSKPHVAAAIARVTSAS